MNENIHGPFPTLKKMTPCDRRNLQNVSDIPL